MRSALAALVVVAFVAVVPAAHAAQNDDEGFLPGEVEAGRALLAHVPADLRMYCSLNEVFHKIPVPDDVLARVDCQLPKGLGADTLTYYQFASTAAMNNAYQSNLQTRDASTLDGCQPDAPYSVNGQEVGRSSCTSDTLGAYIDFTYAPLRIVGSINKFGDTPGGIDVAGLNDFSNQRALPATTAGAIPSRLTGSQARQAAAALRSHLPKALRSKCKQQFVDATPWVSASLLCIKPAPGVDSMDLSSIRTKAAFMFDPQAIVDRSDASNPTCPNQGTWSTNGHVLGRFACSYDKAGNTFLAWTLDRDRISATAGSNDDRMTSKQLLAWWDQKASLTP